MLNRKLSYNTMSNNVSTILWRTNCRHYYGEQSVDNTMSNKVSTIRCRTKCRPWDELDAFPESMFERKVEGKK